MIRTYILDGKDCPSVTTTLDRREEIANYGLRTAPWVWLWLNSEPMIRACHTKLAWYFYSSDIADEE